MQPSTANLPYWEAMHTTALTAQCFSLLGSAIIIASFFMIPGKKKLFNYEVLFINIADFFWVFWHFTNHIDAASNGHVTDNERFCTAMGMFTHLGIGWELMWLCCLASHAFYLFWRLNHGELSIWDPSSRTKKLVFCVCWGFPIIWWLIFGVSTGSYKSTGYYCWVDVGSVWRTWVFADGPLLISFAYVFSCYSYIIYCLVVAGQTNVYRSYSSEIRRNVMYIVVYALWVHPYVAITIYMQATGETPYKFWLYFLFMVNSLGTFNFIAYGISERWFLGIKSWVTGVPLEDLLSKKMGLGSSSDISISREVSTTNIRLSTISKTEDKSGSASRTEDKPDSGKDSSREVV